MANIVILGGGFAGVVAAEKLAEKLGKRHRLTLVSKQREFIFYPALVKLAFGEVAPADLRFDLSEAMARHHVEFMQAEIAHPEPATQQVVIRNEQFEGRLNYDYLVIALGRKLKLESIPGFAEHAHHLMSVEAAQKFGEAVRHFEQGRAIIGYCPDARLAVPVYETAFALDRVLRERGDRHKVQISIVSPDHLGALVGGEAIVPALQKSLKDHDVEFIADFPISEVTHDEIISTEGKRLNHNLLMLIPPATGLDEIKYTGLGDANDFVRVNRQMKVTGAERIYAAGDCVNFLGAKLGHMAVMQAEVLAENLAAEIEGREPAARYDHELMLVIDAEGGDSIYLEKKLWEKSGVVVGQNRFWGWAKWIHARYWQRLHD